MIYLTNELEFNVGEGISAFYFYANWLPYHKKMSIMISKVEELHKDFKFYAIDIEHFKNAIKRFNIESIPTIIIMKDYGKEIKRINGLTMTSAFKKVFTDIYTLYGEKNAKKDKET